MVKQLFGSRFSRGCRALMALGLFLSLVVVVGGSPAGAVSLYSVAATIPVGSGPGHVAVDSSRNTVYVANYESNTISVINGSTNTVVATIPVVSNPWGIAVDATTQRVYVAITTGTVAVIDETTNTVIASIPVGEDPTEITVDEANGKVYVANSDSNTVSVINEATNVVTATIAVGTFPTGIAVDSSRGNVFVSTDDLTIQRISTATNVVVEAISVPALATDVGVDPTTGYFFGSFTPTDQVGAYAEDDSSSTLIPDVADTFQLAVDPVAGRIYVTNQVHAMISVIAESTLSVVDTVDVGSYPTGIDVNTTTHSIYVTNYASNTVSVIDYAFDGTAPTVTYSGNQGIYTVDQTVDITCTAADEEGGSGLASTTCADITGPAYSFGLGSHTYSATATDNAGNIGDGEVSFTVIVTIDSLKQLTAQFESSPIVNFQLQFELNNVKRFGYGPLKYILVGFYVKSVNLQRGRTLSAAQADTLITLAKAL